jgi:hypothetical protein
MYKQLGLFARFFLVSFSFYLLLAACKPENDGYPNSPSGQIEASENLVLPASVSLPANEPLGNSRIATYYAKGVQKYKAQVKAADPAAFEWVFIGPDAKLYDVSNAKIGSHGAGPHWTLTPADSIFAQQFAPPRTAPSPDPNSIDWLLLMTKVGTTPTGVFAEVDYIQRIATEGGKAPATAPKSAKETVDVPYTAIYRFSKKNP